MWVCASRDCNYSVCVSVVVVMVCILKVVVVVSVSRDCSYGTCRRGRGLGGCIESRKSFCVHWQGCSYRIKSYFIRENTIETHGCLQSRVNEILVS